MHPPSLRIKLLICILTSVGFKSTIIAKSKVIILVQTLPLIMPNKLNIMNGSTQIQTLDLWVLESAIEWHAHPLSLVTYYSVVAKTLRRISKPKSLLFQIQNKFRSEYTWHCQSNLSSVKRTSLIVYKTFQIFFKLDSISSSFLFKTVFLADMLIAAANHGG